MYQLVDVTCGDQHVYVTCGDQLVYVTCGDQHVYVTCGDQHVYVSMCQYVLTHADCCYNRTQSVLELLVDNTHVGTSSTSWALLDDNRKYYF